MWNQILIEAIGEFTYKFPGALEKLKTITPDEAWEGPNAELFRNAACVLVEPEAFLGSNRDNESLAREMEAYHEKCENGMGFVKGAIDCVDDSEIWNHLIDVVEETGY